jgi:hypothetical protein
VQLGLLIVWLMACSSLVDDVFTRIFLSVYSNFFDKNFYLFSSSKIFVRVIGGDLDHGEFGGELGYKFF